MVSSDNVLRRGLTRKHADVDELVEIMDFSAGDIPVLTGQAETTGELTYSAPVPEFRLSRLDLDGEQRNNQPPRAACAAEPPGGGHRHRLHRAYASPSGREGQSIWVPAAARDVRLTGTGVVFRATDGLAA